VVFHPDSRLSQIDRRVFYRSGLTAVHLPASIEVIGESCFYSCGSLTSVTFDAGSRLSRIESDAFASSGVQTVHIPASVEFIDPRAFLNCKSVVIDSASPLSAPVSNFTTEMPLSVDSG
jgi:hypothetical protein